MGDDADAHEWDAPVAPDASVGTLVSTILGAGYLPKIGGGRATWFIEGRRPVAVLAQQWTEPRWLVDPETSMAMLSRESGRPGFEVRYWCQVDPERVYASLLAGESLPDRYGR